MNRILYELKKGSPARDRQLQGLQRAARIKQVRYLTDKRL